MATSVCQPSDESVCGSETIGIQYSCSTAPSQLDCLLSEWRRQICRLPTSERVERTRLVLRISVHHKCKLGIVRSITNEC